MKPLTTRQRSASLLVLAILFAITAPIILLYSLGYRLDGENSLQKTGGIFIHSNESGTALFVDGEFLKNNGIFIRNTLIQDLTPNKEYKVEVHKDGYRSWVKSLYVYPSIVTEGRVMMLPETIEKREILPYVSAGGTATSTAPSKAAKPNNQEYVLAVSAFSTSTKETKGAATSTVATTTASTSPEEPKSKLELFFEEHGIEDSEKLKNLIVDGKEVSWLAGGNITLYWIDDLSSIPYYYCGGEERVCTDSISLDWGDDIGRFDYYPGRDDVWIILTANGIYAVEVDGRTQRNIQPILTGENLDFRLTQNDALIVKDGSRFYEINL